MNIKIDITQLTYERAEQYARDGIITEAQFEHYNYLWRNSAARLSSIAESYTKRGAS